MGRAHRGEQNQLRDRRTAVSALLACLAAGLIWLAAPALALGSTVTLAGGTLTYTGSAAPNTLNIYVSGTNIAVLDSEPISATGCSPGGVNQVLCPAVSVDRIVANLGDGNDNLEFCSPGHTEGQCPDSPNKPTILNGGPGNDTIRGGAGDDVMDGGTGDDRLSGDVGGQDTVTYAGRGEDVYINISTTSGFATVGPVEVDSIIGPTIFNLITGSGSDTLVGNQFGNRLEGGPGADTMCGNLGTDTVDYSSRTAPVDVSLNGPDPLPNSQTCVSPVGPGTPGYHPNDCVPDDGELNEHDCVGRDVENVLGGSGDDRLVGSDPQDPGGSNAQKYGINVLEGRGGNDTLDGGLGPDVLDGGAGTDTATYANRTEPVTASIDGATDDGGDADFDPVSNRSDTINPSVENLIGGSGDDIVRGSDGPNTLDGGPGNDFVNGEGGGDTARGGPGDDRVQGGEGDDSVLGEDGNDSLDGGAGADSVDGGVGDDTVKGGPQGDLLVGGDGSDTGDYSDALTPVAVSPNGVGDDGSAGEGDNVAGDIESLVGGIDDDILIGNDAAGTLDGGGGNDTLDGAGGPDTLIGGAGSDYATYERRGGVVNASLDNAANDGEAGEGDNVMTSVEKLIGGAAGDRLAGSPVANFLDGRGGNDNLTGGDGFDTIEGGDGDDSISAGAGDDSLSGGRGNDNMKGDANSDELNGDVGDDTLDGGTGGDAINGDQGVDTADYRSRTADVNVTLDGGPNDGEAKELDVVKFDVENVATGRGDDTIDSRDGVRGRISCGGGTDVVDADSLDVVASDCERSRVSAASVCAVRAAGTMSRSGVVTLRLNCQVTGKGTLRLLTDSKTLRRALRSDAGSARNVTLARKSFSITAGKSKSVKVKLARKARRAVLRRKRLGTRVEVRLRGTGASASRKATARVTIKAPKRKRR